MHYGQSEYSWVLKQYVLVFCGKKALYKELLYHFSFVIILGVLDMTGEFLIPIPSWSTIVTKAGTKIVYKRDHYQYADEILTQCPITQDLKLVVRISLYNIQINVGKVLHEDVVEATTSHQWGYGFEPCIEYLIARGKSWSTLCRHSWAFSRGFSGFLLQEKLTAWLSISS